MARTAIWDDVDPMRSMTAPGCFAPSFGFDSYAESILKTPAVFSLAVDESGRKRSVYQHQRTNEELYATDDMDKSTIELILSLLFFDVRFKTYIEIRAADSLPIEYALAFAALIKGLFYSKGFIAELDERLKDFGTTDIAAAKRDLAAKGYQATVYGLSAAEWLDELLAVAAVSLSGTSDGHSQPLPLPSALKDAPGAADESAYLRPLAELVQQRATLVELTK
jgi:glutamate--cysteine ligase